MSVSYSDWTTWAARYEPTAFVGFTTSPVAQDAYDEANVMLLPMIDYLDTVIYRLGVYRLAMHNLIVASSVCASPLNSLYTKYEMKENTGLLVSASDSTSAATKFIPDATQKGDASTMLLWATPYGQQVEALFEQLRNISITI
jgi:hypothetical protein